MFSDYTGKGQLRLYAPSTFVVLPKCGSSGQRLRLFQQALRVVTTVKGIRFRSAKEVNGDTEFTGVCRITL